MIDEDCRLVDTVASGTNRIIYIYNLKWDNKPVVFHFVKLLSSNSFDKNYVTTVTTNVIK